MNARLVWAVLCLSSVAGCGLTLDNDPPDVTDAGTARDAQPSLDGGGVDGALDGGTTQCVHDVDCADGVYCNGEERCVEGSCTAGSHPCGDPPACARSICDEAARACATEPITCPSGTVCDPGAGTCVTAPECISNTDCPNDGIDCNGTNVCVDGRCVPSPDVLACADLDAIDCTVPTCRADGCAELPVDALCDDPFPDDCMVPRCSSSGCVLVPSAVACDDGYACTIDSCLVPREGEPGSCVHQAPPGSTVCDDGAACTHDACDPEAPVHDAAGCTHEPDDAICALGSEPGCGFAICVGAEALRAYPSFLGCAPNLSSQACGTGAVRCVASLGGGGAACMSFADGCASDRDCNDGNPCNGEERCAGGSCERMTVGCPPMPCATPWCDLTATPIACRYRPEPACSGDG